MNLLKLKFYAEQLDAAIQKHRTSNSDVEWLATYSTLTSAISAAKAGTLVTPMRDLGCGRFVLESEIPGIREVAEPLSSFTLLVEGFDLPEDH